ncbi:MAG: hypothetical protein ACYC4L_06925 [Chloroflexota bacterium]
MTMKPFAERERHTRALVYVIVSFTLALLGFLFLGFDRGQTLAYAVTSYVVLNALNYRAMFVRTSPRGDLER